MKHWAFILLAAVALSCHRPSSTEEFIRGEGPYLFIVDLSDSTACYNFDLYTRIDALDYPADIRLDVTWKAPSDSVFKETVYLPVTEGASRFSHEVYAPYRAQTVPAQWGVWTLEIAVPERPQGLCGMGLVTRKVWDTEN